MLIYLHKQNAVYNYTQDNSTTILQFLQNNRLMFLAPCNGNGTCGKCKVYVSGKLSPITSDEKEKLTPEEIESGIRLACRTNIIGDCHIYLSNSETHLNDTKDSFETDFIIDPVKHSKTGIGAAVDIGTTCVAIKWYSLETGEQLDSESFLNPQTRYGSDIISRLTYASKNGVSELKNSIESSLKDTFNKNPNKADVFVITGNSVMLHFLNGDDTSGFCAAPFTPKSLYGNWKDNAYFPNCISAFVGADITTAILRSKMIFDKSSFLVDLGTNGEMAYWNGSDLKCCSTAAGPAFEGAGISCGMPAIPGAICKVYIENGSIKYETVNNESAIGICGSGIIDLIACLIKLGVIDSDGYMEDNYYLPNSEVYITPQDIREIQLAKSAISAGIQTLCEDIKGLDKFYIAGAFGKYINLENAVSIGFLPKDILNKTILLGNAALLGASMILLNSSALNDSKTIANAAETVDLSSNPIFSQNYINNIIFEEVLN